MGWTAPGQWFKYTVNVATAGSYTVSFRVAAPCGITDALHIANSSGTNLTGSVAVPEHRRLPDLDHGHRQRHPAGRAADADRRPGRQRLEPPLSGLHPGIGRRAAPAAATGPTEYCGTQDLALDQPTTASSTQDATDYPASDATDGDPGTRWSSAFSDPQWLEVDLGSPQQICSVGILWEAAYASAFQIQVSNDNSTWTNIYSTTTGTGGTRRSPPP